tara:strand:+ start:647 stop:1129 length:483 start_codon:yes stop_codon:yes gene_type:complete
MARITVEDCIDKFESRFELVLVASNRARKLHAGDNPTVEKDNDKPTVIALREIAGESLPIDSLKQKLIEEYQTVSPLDDEELSFDYDGSESEMRDEITENESQLNKENEEEKVLNDNELNEAKDQDLDHDKDQHQDQDDSILPTNNDGYTDIKDDNNPEN